MTKSETLPRYKPENYLFTLIIIRTVLDMEAPSLLGYFCDVIATGSATPGSVAIRQLQAPDVAEPSTTQSSQLF